MIAIGDEFRMPHRQPGDPDPSDMGVSRLGRHHLIITGFGAADCVISEWTAARLIGVLSLMLGLRFIRKHGKRLTVFGHERGHAGRVRSLVDHAGYDARMRDTPRWRTVRTAARAWGRLALAEQEDSDDLVYQAERRRTGTRRTAQAADDG